MEVKKILIVHASRGRPIRGIQSAISFIHQMSTEIPFTYVFSLDTDDPKLLEYQKNIGELPFSSKVVIRNNNGSVQATNYGAEFLTDEDLIFVNGDDLGTSNSFGWDEKLLKFISTIDTDSFLIHLPSGIPNSNECAIIQCMSAGLYKKMGTIFYPEYISMFADNDVFMTAKAMGAVRTYTGEPLNFTHDHPSFGRGEWDDTYTRTNRKEAWEIGHRIFCRRQEENFGVK